MDLEYTRNYRISGLKGEKKQGSKKHSVEIVLLLPIEESRHDGILSQKLPKKIKVFPRIKILSPS